MFRSQLNLVERHHYSWREKIPEIALKAPRWFILINVRDLNGKDNGQ